MEGGRTITVGGIDTFLYDVGEGQPFIMLHGIGANSEIYRYTVAEFSKSYRCIVPDFPGNGRTGGSLSKPYSVTFYVSWLTTLINQLELQPPYILMAVSMGAAIASMYTARNEHKIEKLILSDALGVSDHFPWETTSTVLPRLRHGLGALLGDDPESMYRYLEGKVIREPRGHAKPAVDAMTAATRQSGLWPLVSGGRLLIVDMLMPARRKKFLQQIKGIQTPTLITWGRHDGIISVNSAGAAQQNLPHAHVKILENSAHAPMVDEPETFNGYVQKFLASEPL